MLFRRNFARNFFLHWVIFCEQTVLFRQMYTFFYAMEGGVPQTVRRLEE